MGLAYTCEYSLQLSLMEMSWIFPGYFVSTSHWLFGCLSFMCTSTSFKKKCCVMQKRVFGHMRTAKTQLSLRMRTIWSEFSFSAKRLIWNYSMYQLRANARMRLFACAVRTWICAFCPCFRRHVFALCAQITTGNIRSHFTETALWLK